MCRCVWDTCNLNTHGMLTGRSDVRQVLPCFMLLKCWGLVLSLVGLKWCLRLMSVDSIGQDNGSHRFSWWWSLLKQTLKALWVPFMIGYIFHWSSIDSFEEYFFELSACLLYDVTITGKTVAQIWGNWNAGLGSRSPELPSSALWGPTVPSFPIVSSPTPLVQGRSSSSVAK